ncbi:uncharacterized protein LOC143085161 [Mytilus galloprovincialis]|uniref:Uncharacterized protein n=1 Tax=Mytilus edulis TaxID=6550 RepID=A0A8S3R9J5_MYTED|nr:unnamed protein product [Mytilus edulis]
MATGHILPGYGNPVTNLRRAKTATLPLDKAKLREFALYNNPGPDHNELLNIRNEATRIWSAQARHPTTYNSHFEGKFLDEATQSRPSSRCRRNKPHPRQVFLTNRLHYIPGYHNPDASMNKDVYRVDALMPYEDQMDRRQIRQKFVARQSSPAMNQYKDPMGVREEFEPEDVSAAEAWMKVADDKTREEKDKLINALEDLKRETKVEPPTWTDRVETSPMPAVTSAVIPQPSLHRWMKFAGTNENANLQRVLQQIRSEKMMGSPSSSRVGSNTSLRQRRRQDMISMRKAVNPTLTRGEFQMHPEWPPSIPHHWFP